MKSKEANRANPSMVFLGYAVDVVAPMATYFVLSKLGVTPLFGLLLGTAIALGSTAINTLRRRRIDRLGILVIIELGLSIVLLFVTHDPRFLLAKPSFYTAIAGVYLIATSFRGKPLTYDGALQMGTRGDPMRATAFACCWERSPQFRTTLRVASVGWGVACLVDAVLRVIVVYRFPVERAAWLSNVPHLAAIAVLMAFSALMGRRTHRMVDEQLSEMRAGSAEGTPVRESHA